MDHIFLLSVNYAILAPIAPGYVLGAYTLFVSPIPIVYIFFCNVTELELESNAQMHVF